MNIVERWHHSDEDDIKGDIIVLIFEWVMCAGDEHFNQ